MHCMHSPSNVVVLFFSSQCNCDFVGSLEENCDTIMGQCLCLPDAGGRDCSQCRAGTFNLQSTNPNGCQPCFCSGQSNMCSSASGFYFILLSSVFNSSDTSLLQGWSLVDTNSFLSVSESPPLPFGGGGFTIDADTAAYLEAPANYVGNILSSYSQYISVELVAILDVNVEVESTLEYDVILESNGVRIGANFSRVESGFEVQLHESVGWVYIDSSPSSSSSLTTLEFQRILSSLTRLLISASYNTDVDLTAIRLDTVIHQSELSDDDIANLLEVTSVESCECPKNFTGLSCDACSPGYTRTPLGNCELCQCNGLSTECDPITGDCLNCSGSTAGRSCEVCERGTYGDPLVGIECLPCPCPLTTEAGQFTDECLLLDSGEAMCLNCPSGHRGQLCTW